MWQALPRGMGALPAMAHALLSASSSRLDGCPTALEGSPYPATA